MNNHFLHLGFSVAIMLLGIIFAVKINSESLAFNPKLNYALEGDTNCLLINANFIQHLKKELQLAEVNGTNKKFINIFNSKINDGYYCYALIKDLAVWNNISKDKLTNTNDKSWALSLGINPSNEIIMTFYFEIENDRFLLDSISNVNLLLKTTSLKYENL